MRGVLIAIFLVIIVTCMILESGEAATFVSPLQSPILRLGPTPVIDEGLREKDSSTFNVFIPYLIGEQ